MCDVNTRFDEIDYEPFEDVRYDPYVGDMYIIHGQKQVHYTISADEFVRLYGDEQVGCVKALAENVLDVYHY